MAAPDRWLRLRTRCSTERGRGAADADEPSLLEDVEGGAVGEVAVSPAADSNKARCVVTTSASRAVWACLALAAPFLFLVRTKGRAPSSRQVWHTGRKDLHSTLSSSSTHPKVLAILYVSAISNRVNFFLLLMRLFFSCFFLFFFFNARCRILVLGDLYVKGHA